MAGLTKQHFEEIAKIINERVNLHKYNNENKIVILTQLMEDLSNYFKTQNPNFDEKRFKEACLK